MKYDLKFDINKNSLCKIGIAHLHKSKRPIYEQEESHIAPSIDEDKFKYCIPLKLKCQNESCKAEIEISDVVIDNVSKFSRIYLFFNPFLK